MFFFGKDIEKNDLGGGVGRRIVAHSGKLMTVEVHFESGAIGAMHTHPHEQISYVISGKYEATVGGETKIISAGDSYYVKPNALHGLTCIDGGILLDIFTPQREDFLK